jgi:asparagine synthase (glutamine-hydrolysing)
VAVDDVRIEPNEIPDLLQRLAWHYDEPLPRPHHLAAFAVARDARAAGFKVLVSGEGGDELFGGYQRYVTLTNYMSRTGDTSPLVYAQNRDACARIARFWPHPTFANDFRERAAESTRGLDLINRQLLVDQMTFLQHFLQRSDRMGMAAGVENRVPLLDLELVEYTNRLPGRLKVDGSLTKVGLKAALTGVLPDAVLHRPKRAFEMPMAPLLCAGPVADLLNDCLLDHPRSAAIFDQDGVRSLVSDLRAGHDELWKVVWLLLTTELWLRTFNVSV